MSFHIKIQPKRGWPTNSPKFEFSIDDDPDSILGCGDSLELSGVYPH